MASDTKLTSIYSERAIYLEVQLTIERAGFELGFKVGTRVCYYHRFRLDLVLYTRKMQFQVCRSLVSKMLANLALSKCNAMKEDQTNCYIYGIFGRFRMRHWFSGTILALGASDPGSIPGCRLDLHDSRFVLRAPILLLSFAVLSSWEYYVSQYSVLVLLVVKAEGVHFSPGMMVSCSQ